MAKYEVYYDEFKDLWLREDCDWIDNRKKILKKILKNREEYYRRGLGSAHYKQQLTRYFVYGELLRYPDLIVNEKIGSNDRILCVPWTTKEELESVFNYRLHTATTRRELTLSFPIVSSYYYRGIPEEWSRIQLFCDVMFGDKYKEVKSPNLPGSDQLEIISLAPDEFVTNYILGSIRMLSRVNENNLSWLNCCFKYFTSCARYIGDQNFEYEERLLRKLFNLFDAVLEKKPEFDQYQKDVFDGLYAFMMAKDAPKFIVEFREKFLAEY